MARNVPAAGWPATSAITSGMPTPMVHRSAESGSTCDRSMRSADEKACCQMAGGAERSSGGDEVTSGLRGDGYSHAVPGRRDVTRPLFALQQFRWARLPCPPRRPIRAGEREHGKEGRDGGGEREIGVRRSADDALDGRRGRRQAGNARQRAGENDRNSFAGEHANDVSRPRAERLPDRKLARARAGGIRDARVQADAA